MMPLIPLRIFHIPAFLAPTASASTRASVSLSNTCCARRTLAPAPSSSPGPRRRRAVRVPLRRPTPEIPVHVQQNPQGVPRPDLRHIFPLRGKRRLHLPRCTVERVLPPTTQSARRLTARSGKQTRLTGTYCATNPRPSHPPVNQRRPSHAHSPALTHLVQVLVRDQRKPELRAAPDNARRPTLEERLEALFAVWHTPSSAGQVSIIPLGSGAHQAKMAHRS